MKQSGQHAEDVFVRCHAHAFGLDFQRLRDADISGVLTTGTLVETFVATNSELLRTAVTKSAVFERARRDRSQELGGKHGGEREHSFADEQTQEEGFHFGRKRHVCDGFRAKINKLHTRIQVRNKALGRLIEQLGFVGASLSTNALDQPRYPEEDVLREKFVDVLQLHSQREFFELANRSFELGFRQFKRLS